MHSLNTEQIQQIIPHRHPFLLIDQIEDYVPGEYAVGYKGVSYHEDFFRGHFPQKAVMPGVLILEALAQTGAVAILSLPENRGKIAFFGGVQKCRFKGMVLPGDRLRLEFVALRHSISGYVPAIIDHDDIQRKSLKYFDLGTDYKPPSRLVVHFVDH